MLNLCSAALGESRKQLNQLHVAIKAMSVTHSHSPIIGELDAAKSKEH